MEYFTTIKFREGMGGRLLTLSAPIILKFVRKVSHTVNFYRILNKYDDIICTFSRGNKYRTTRKLEKRLLSRCVFEFANFTSNGLFIEDRYSKLEPYIMGTNEEFDNLIVKDLF